MNIIVILADSCRVDHLGFYGGNVATPNLDALAAEATVFDQAYGENLPTLPCRTALWTGQYLFTSRGWESFHEDDVLLAEVLWDKGYTSALVTDTYHLHKPGFNCGRGFDTVRFIRGQEYDPWIVDGRAVDTDAWYRFRGDKDDAMWRERAAQYLRNRTAFQSEEDHCTPRVIRSAIDWLDEVTASQKDRLFLWVDCFDPHEPWDPPEPFRSMYDPGYSGQELIDPIPGPVEGYLTGPELAHTKALYAGQVSFVDKWIGVLLDHVRRLGLYENSLIVFLSDHGEPFGEHGIIRKASGSINYEEVAHIPLVIRHPEGVGAGKRVPSFVQPPDLMPTLLAAAGVETDLRFGGHRLMGLMRGRGKPVRDFAVTAQHGAQWSVRTERWTYLVHLQGDRSDELYDRQADPREKLNVIAELPEVAVELAAGLRRFADKVS